MHLLSRDEIEQMRRAVLGQGDDETDAMWNVLCDMALAHLDYTLSRLKADRSMSQALNEGDGSYKP